jgi:hypothetical protein
MKKTLLHLAMLFALCGSLHAHGRFVFNPGGGRILAIDSVTTPNAEFKVSADRRFEITFLDKDRKPIALGKRKLVVTAGDRSAAKKLSVEAKGETLVTETAPEGDDYCVIMQLREPGAAKSIPFRLHFNTSVCSECKQPEWHCDCGSKKSGKNVEIPTDLAGLWAEINQHTEELHEGTTNKAYEAVDEVTEAFPALASALPGKTDAAKQAEAGKLVDELKAALSGVRDAFAARKPAEAETYLDNVAKTLTKLKSLYPAEVVNAKLKE